MAATHSTSLLALAQGANRDRLNLVLGHARFAIDRAAAHVEDPAGFPIPPDADSLERIYAASFAGLKPAARRQLARAARRHLEAEPSARAARYGQMGNRSPREPLDVLHELRIAIKAPRFALTPAELERGPSEIPLPRPPGSDAAARGRPRRTGALAGRARAAAGVATSLELFARSITCIDDTREVGKDEISLAGIRQEARIDANSGKVSVSRSIFGPIDLGKFKKGDSHQINSQIATFDLDATPKLCSFDLFLAETDVLKGFEKELREALDFIPERLDEILGSISIGALLSGAAPLFFPGSWPFYLVLLIIVATILLANAIVIAIRDDVFPSRQTGIPVTSADFVFPGDSLQTTPETFSFEKFGGKYQLEFQWRLV